jgi:hypothetical protein
VGDRGLLDCAHVAILLGWMSDIHRQECIVVGTFAQIVMSVKELQRAELLHERAQRTCPQLIPRNVGAAAGEALGAQMLGSGAISSQVGASLSAQTFLILADSDTQQRDQVQYLRSL